MGLLSRSSRLTEARPSKLAVCILVHLAQRLKDDLLLFQRNSDSSVADADVEHLPFLLVILRVGKGLEGGWGQGGPLLVAAAREMVPASTEIFIFMAKLNPTHLNQRRDCD